jgi:hypothetical protein
VANTWIDGDTVVCIHGLSLHRLSEKAYHNPCSPRWKELSILLLWQMHIDYDWWHQGVRNENCGFLLIILISYIASDFWILICSMHFLSCITAAL